MQRRSIGTDFSMCVQPTFIIGTYNEDRSPNFAPITWVSATCEGDAYLLVISMFGTKATKLNVQRTRMLSVNLADRSMLPLVDYFGSHHKAALPADCPWEACRTVDAPTLSDSRWVYECEVASSVQTGASDTFFCRIRDIQLDARVDVKGTFDIDLTKLDPIIYSGQYHSLGENLGKIGDFLNK